MPDNDKQKKSNPAGIFDALEKNLGVMTDFGAMKFADLMVDFVIDQIERSHPQLAQRLIVAAQKHPAQTQAMLVTSLQILASSIKPILPAQLRGIGEDFLAKIPTSVSEALKRLAAKPTPTGIRFGERDFGNLEREISQKLSGQAAVTADTFSNFALFVMQLDDAQLTTFYAGLQELSDAKRRRLEAMFASMKPQQIGQILQRLPRNPVSGKDWSVLFGIFNDMGFLSDEKEAEHVTPANKESSVLTVIMSIDDAAVRDRIIAFLAVFAKDKTGQYQLVLQRMAGWLVEDFTRFSGFSSHELMASLLGITLPQQVPDEGDKTSFIEELYAKWRKSRDEGHERDRKAGKTLADKAVEVVSSDPRLSGIAPLFRSLADVLNTNTVH
ncbi:MAG: hypothetical protein WCT27_00060 [Patescibacteria group bacterium]